MHCIFLHGLGQTPASWEQAVSELEGALSAECPGLPALLGNREATYQNLYQAFAGFCERFSGPVHLCGLSLGAVLALQYAIEHPAKVKSLVLIGVQYQMPKRLLSFQTAVFRLMPERLFQNMGFCKKAFLRLTGSMRDLDFSRELGRVSCPALILCGERDGANRKAAQTAAGKIPHARLQWIGEAGHEVNVQAPQKLTETLTAFYQEQAST